MHARTHQLVPDRVKLQTDNGVEGLGQTILQAEELLIQLKNDTHIRLDQVQGLLTRTQGVCYKIPCVVQAAHSWIPTTLPTPVQYKQPTPGYQPPYPPRYSTSSPLLDTNHPTHPGTVQAAHSWIPTTLPTPVQYKQPTPGYQPPYPPRYSTSSPLLDTNHPTHPGTVQAAHSWIPTTLPTPVQYKQLTPGFPLCSSSKQDFMISKMATCMVHMRGVIRCLNSTTSGWVQQNRQSHIRLYAYLIKT